MATIENGSTSVNAVKMYIYDDAVICGILPEGVEEGLTWEDQLNGKYLLLSAAQIEFFLENPNLAASEIYNLTTDDEADYTFLREEYLRKNEELYNDWIKSHSAGIQYINADGSGKKTIFFNYSYEELTLMSAATTEDTLTLYLKEGVEDGDTSENPITISKSDLTGFMYSYKMALAQYLQVNKRMEHEIRQLRTKSDFNNYKFNPGYPYAIIRQITKEENE